MIIIIIWVYVYIYIYIHIHICIYTYIYTYRRPRTAKSAAMARRLEPLPSALTDGVIGLSGSAFACGGAQCIVSCHRMSYRVIP